MPTRQTGLRPMTEHDIKVAGDLGEMKADIRTVKHDLANIQQGMIALGTKMDGVTNRQQRGLGFFAGMAFIITTFGAFLIALAKLVWLGGGAGGAHP